MEGALRGINGLMPLSELVTDLTVVSNTDSIKNMEFMCWNIFCHLDLNSRLYFSECYQAALIQKEGEEKVTLGGQN